MKKFYLLTKTLLVAVCLLAGASDVWGQVSTWTAASGTYTKGQEIKGNTEGIIVMTLGNDDAWTYDSGRAGIVTRTQQSPTLTDGIPTAGGYVTITPVRTLKLSMTSYSSMSNCNVYMYDGTTKIKDFRQKGDNTNDYGKLEAGHTYYIYGGAFKKTGDLEYVFFKNFTATTYETYTIHYVDDSATPVTIKEDRVVSGVSLFGATVSAEESDLANIVYNENTYAYKSGNTPITLRTSGNEITLVFAKATAANVKIKYTANIADVLTEIKDAVNVESSVGATVTATGENFPTYITYSDVKYKYSSGNNPLTVTGVAEDDVISLVYTPAPIYSYEVNAYDGSDNKLADITSGNYVEGDAAVSVRYARWILSGTTLYSSGSGTVTYSTSFTPDVDDYEKKITYNSGTVNDVIFFTEGEDVTGASIGNNAARASMGKMGFTANSETYLNATTLMPGKYQIYMRTQNGNSASRNYNFKAGEDVVFTGSFGNGTNTDANSDEFAVYKSSTLSFASDGSDASGIDYFYVVQTDKDVTDAIADCKTHETSDAFATYIDGLYAAGSLTTVAGVYAAHTAWQIAQADAASSNDITKVIFDAQVSSNTRWNSARTLSGQEYTGAPDNTYFDAWNTDASDASQTIYGLPAGTYTIKVATRSSAGVTDKSKYNVWVSGGSANVSLLGSHIGNQGGNLGNGWNWTILSFTLDAGADVTIGFYACPTSSLWAGCDDWHLYKGTLETSVSASVSASKYATFVSPYSLDFTSTSIKAHTAVVNTETGVVTLTETNQIPSNTPVVLYYEGGAKDENIPVIASADAVGDNNLFAGAGAGIEVATGTSPYNYVLDDAEGIGFYKANNVTVATNRAYLQTTYNVAESSARGMRMVFAGDITGISEAAATAEAAQKDGKFIENGKLVIVKNGKKYNANGALIY